jgi:hypothetical protein
MEIPMQRRDIDLDQILRGAIHLGIASGAFRL